MDRYQSYAVIIYVTETEKQAVMRMFDWKDLRIKYDDQPYKEAFIEKDGKRLRIISGQQDEMGMTASATLTTKMIHHFVPEYVLMPGIAAGTKNILGSYTQEFGDVLLADAVWNYSNGKYVSPHEAEIVFGEIGFNPRPTMVKISGDHLAEIQAFILSGKSECYVHCGPLASGTAVVANQSVIKKQIYTSFENTEGVEMESYGVAYAVIRSKIKEMVDAENKSSPLSDDAIAETLQKQGFDIARRTVAKYRQELSIPSSRQRKSWVAVK